MNCAACILKIGRGEILACSSCHGTYHYRCLNMTTAYYVENKQFLLHSWCCPNCENITKRNRNDDTPTRKQNQHQCQLNDTNMSVDDYIHHDNKIGETLTSNMQSKEITSPRSNIEIITLDKIGQLLDKKLDEKLERQRKSIITELRQTMESQITIAINKLTQQMTTSIDTLNMEQTQIKNNINNIDEKIELLETENKVLKNEIEKLQYSTKNTTIRSPEMEQKHENKLVIYGLNENYDEQQHVLEHRVISLFLQCMNVDLTGYIEEIFRMGKRGYRRPIQIELISKRMTKYLLNNARRLKSTGIYVSEFLNKNTLEEKRKQRTAYPNLRPSQETPPSTSSQQAPLPEATTSRYSLSDLNTMESENVTKRSHSFRQ